MIVVSAGLGAVSALIGALLAALITGAYWERRSRIRGAARWWPTPWGSP